MDKIMSDNKQHTWDELRDIASWAASSSLFPDVAGDEHKAVATLALGQELGFGPISALINVFFRNKQPALTSAAMAAKIASHPNYDYKITQHTDKACTVQFYRGKKLLGESTYTLEDARRLHNVQTTFWQMHAKRTLFARALSTGVACYCAEVFGGRIYTLADFEDSEPGPDGHLQPLTPELAAIEQARTREEADRLRKAKDISAIVTHFHGDEATALAAAARFMGASATADWPQFFADDVAAFAKSLEPTVPSNGKPNGARLRTRRPRTDAATPSIP